MHRHGYQGRKFGRERDARQALISGLASSLILHESVETTLPKAKEASRYLEKLISKAKAGGLHNRRQVIAGLPDLESAHKLFDDIAPKLSGRGSGYLRIKRTGFRRGDRVQLAKVGFVDDLKAKVLAKKTKARTKSPARKVAATKKTTKGSSK